MASCGTAPGKATRAISAESARRAAPCSSDWRCRVAPASAGSSPTVQTCSIAAADRAERSARCDVRKARGHERPKPGENTMTDHKTGTRKEWLAARPEVLQAEEELTPRGDELAQRRGEPSRGSFAKT